jgi:hypothetical protein
MEVDGFLVNAEPDECARLDPRWVPSVCGETRVHDAQPQLDEAAVGRIFREESGRSVAALIRVFGGIDVAEDAVQDAFAVAALSDRRRSTP